MSKIDLYKGDYLETYPWEASSIYADGDIFEYKGQLFEVKIEEKDSCSNTIGGTYVSQEDFEIAKKCIKDTVVDKGLIDD